METKRKLEWQSLFSDKIDFKIKNILTDKERLYNDQEIQEEDITIVIVYPTYKHLNT